MDVPAPIGQDFIVRVTLRQADGRMQVDFPNDLGIAMHMLALAMKEVTDKLMRIRMSEKPRVEQANGALLKALPPVGKGD